MFVHPCFHKQPLGKRAEISGEIKALGFFAYLSNSSGSQGQAAGHSPGWVGSWGTGVEFIVPHKGEKSSSPQPSTTQNGQISAMKRAFGGGSRGGEGIYRLDFPAWISAGVPCAPEQPHKCPNSEEGLKQKKPEPLGGEELPSLSQLFPWEPEPKMMLANDVGE